MTLSEVDTANRHKLSGLFQGHLGGLIPQAILDGYLGRALASSNLEFAVLDIPATRLAILGGDASHPDAKAYLKSLPRFSQVFYNHEDFIDTAQGVHPGKWIELERYAFSAETLDLEHLRSLKGKCPEGFTMTKIDLSLAQQLKQRKNRFAAAHGMTFASPEDFITRGFGYCALQKEEIACVGSSFAVCDKGIEIQIDTKKKFQGHGLASTVAAHLIVDCLERNLIPSWDAATPISARFAEKLGYTPQGKYTMLAFTNSRFLVSLRKTIRRIRSLRA
ncbi:MAG: GNAT family N-acetyltransferase [Chloroflexota bacterium]